MPVKHVEQENTFSATCKLQVFFIRCTVTISLFNLNT